MGGIQRIVIADQTVNYRLKNNFKKIVSLFFLNQTKYFAKSS